MKSLTYKELLEALQKIEPDRLEDTAAVLVKDECFEISTLSIMGEEQDILDPGHYVINLR